MSNCPQQAPPKKIPHTVENTRKISETAVREEDEEVLDEENVDEFASYFVEGLTPKGEVSSFLQSFLIFFSYCYNFEICLQKRKKICTPNRSNCPYL
jgi:hypothetical protein